VGVTWHRAVIELEAHDAELAADVLWQAGAAGVEEQPVATAAAELGSVRLLAGFGDRASATAACDELERRGFGVGRVEPVTDDGLDGWRPWAEPQRAGPFVVTPPWCDEQHLAGTRTLWVDPGRTFGSGSHATTRLVLAAVAELVVPGASVLDVGTGSGVLAIGAALVGATPVVAIDLDPSSPEVVVANAARNGVSAQVRASTDALAAVPADPPFDLVLANLLAPILVELAPELRRVTAPGAPLVVSGLLADRWREVLGPLHGFTVAPDGVRTDDGWAALVLIRDGAR
jgi:ribosomal protein L11 methyltransferase